MKDEHERKIMFVLIQTDLNSNLVYRFKEISRITGIPESSLQRILPRLEKRGWIEKNESNKIIGYVPVERINDAHFCSYKNRKGEKINVVLSYKSEQKFDDELQKLIRKESHFDMNGRLISKSESYSKVFEKRKKGVKNGKMGHSFQGRTKLLRKYLKNELPKQITYYKIKKYPYLIIKNNKLKIDLKSDFNVPYRKKRFWKQNAKKIKQIYDMLDLPENVILSTELI